MLHNDKNDDNDNADKDNLVWFAKDMSLTLSYLCGRDSSLANTVAVRQWQQPMETVEAKIKTINNQKAKKFGKEDGRSVTAATGRGTTAARVMAT